MGLCGWWFCGFMNPLVVDWRFYAHAVPWTGGSVADCLQEMKALDTCLQGILLCCHGFRVLLLLCFQMPLGFSIGKVPVSKQPVCSFFPLAESDRGSPATNKGLTGSLARHFNTLCAQKVY